MYVYIYIYVYVDIWDDSQICIPDSNPNPNACLRFRAGFITSLWITRASTRAWPGAQKVAPTVCELAKFSRKGRTMQL